MIRLSVIIPGYNTSVTWWRRCVESVRKACGPKDEIICVDDGSKVPVQENWVGADVDDRVRLIRKENGGLSSARNAGLELAQGRYVTFVDSDDEVCSDVYAKTIAKMEATKSAVGIFGVKVIWVDECLAKIDMPDDREYGVLSPNDVYDLSKRCLLNYACNKVYDAQCIRKLSNEWNFRFDREGMPNEDIIFNLECIMIGSRWCSVNYCGYVYYRQGVTLLSRYKPSCHQGYICRANTWKRYLERIEEFKVAVTDNVRDWIRARGEMSMRSLKEREWANIWMPGSPYTFWSRWKWLRESGGMSFVRGILKYAKMALRSFVRRYFYCRPIRRWNLRRSYAHVMPVHGR